jgi:hypothetical protein
MKGRRQVTEGCLIFETWVVCAIQRVNGQDNIFKCFWMGYGSRCQAHRFVSRTATLLGFLTLNSFLCVSRMFHHPKDIQPTWHNSRKQWSQHGPASLWSSCPNELRLFWGQKWWLVGVQLNIRKVSLMFRTLSLYCPSKVYVEVMIVDRTRTDE